MTGADLHAAALALPAATMDVQWGDDHVFKVGGKMFAATDGAGKTLSFKATDDQPAPQSAAPTSRQKAEAWRAGSQRGDDLSAVPF